jgi:hypothetical protein
MFLKQALLLFFLANFCIIKSFSHHDSIFPLNYELAIPSEYLREDHAQNEFLYGYDDEFYGECDPYFDPYCEYYSPNDFYENPYINEQVETIEEKFCDSFYDPYYCDLEGNEFYFNFEF